MRFKAAENKRKLFEKGKRKLTRDLDIITLIERQQMHDVNKQALYNSTERFLLQYQRRNVIESNSDSMTEIRKFNEQTDWKDLHRQVRRQELQNMLSREF